MIVADKCVSVDEYFDAILAKNALARHIKRDENISSGTKAWIIERLVEIEKVIGTSNQPDVMNIYVSELDI